MHDERKLLQLFYFYNILTIENFARTTKPIITLLLSRVRVRSCTFCNRNVYSTLEVHLSLSIEYTRINTVARFDCAGMILPGAYTKLDNVDEHGEGEICMMGRHVFMGYLNAPEQTAETKDKDGWLHSGDLGRIDSDGFLYITGKAPRDNA